MHGVIHVLYRAAQPHVEKSAHKPVQWQVRLPPQSARSGEEKHEKAQGELAEKLRKGDKGACQRALETKHTQNVEWFSLQ